MGQKGVHAAMMPAKLAIGNILRNFSNCFSNSILGKTGSTFCRSLN